MWRQLKISVIVMMMIGVTLAQRKESKETKEVCPKVCEPEKCPNVGPIGLRQCPAEQYIVTYRCGCCKKCDVRPVTTTVSPEKRDEVCKEMTCPKKKVCVLNIQGLPVCKCPTDELCTKYVKRGAGKKVKVCGSDGITYPSRCHLKVASCASDGKIRVKSKGECVSTKSSLELSTQSISTQKVANSSHNRKKDRKNSHGRVHSKNNRQNNRQSNSKRFSRRGEKRQQKRQNRKGNRKHESGNRNFPRALRAKLQL